jgi:hypothetical protein
MASSRPDSEWARGPVALPMDRDKSTDGAWRRQFVHPRARNSLYGETRRRHRLLIGTPHSRIEIPRASAKDPPREVEATHAELLQFRAARGSRTNALLALHISPVSEGRALVGDLKYLSRELDSRAADGLVEHIQGLAPRGCRVTRGVRHGTLLVFATHKPDAESDPATSDWTPDRPDSWSATDTWRWALAMASPPTTRELREPRPPETPGRLLSMPRRDVQIVDRGVSIVATQRDTRAGARLELEKDEVRTRSMYLDALLLGVVQRVLLAQLADDVASCGDPTRNQRTLRTVQRDVRVFRNRYWWRDFSNWGWPDQVLRAYQEIHGLPTDVDNLTAELSDFATEVEAANSHRINLGLAIIALIGIPGVAATILPAVGAEPAQAGSWLMGIGAVIVAPAIAVIYLLVRSFTADRRHDHIEP